MIKLYINHSSFDLIIDGCICESLSGFGAEFFRLSQEEVSKDDMQKYRTILNSKSNEESLVSTRAQ